MNRIHSWLIVGIIALISSTLSSCGDSDYYYSPLEGTWGLESVNGIPVNTLDYSEFTFYSDGTGVYGQYNRYGNWSTYPITWDLGGTSGGGDVLYIDVPYFGERWVYLIKLFPTRLQMTDMDTGDVLVYVD